MMRKFLATTAIVTLMATGAAFAQTTPAPPAEKVTQQVVHADGHLASDIIGQTVYSGTGNDAENIGKVSDIVLSPDGQAQTAVIGVGGFLGIGKKDVAIDYNLLHWNERDGSRYLVVETTREALEALPVFDVAAYQPMPAAANSADINATDNTHTAAVDRSNMTEVFIADVSADELIGSTVYGVDDEKVGSIADVLLSTDGLVDAVTVDVGGFLGIDAKEVAIDLDNIVFMRQGNNLYLYTSLSKSQLEAQPAYDASTFAASRDQQLLVIPR